MTFIGVQKSCRLSPFLPLLLTSLLSVVAVWADPGQLQLEGAVFRLWADDHQVTGSALAEVPGGPAVLCAVHCLLRPDCWAIQTSDERCRLLENWPRPHQFQPAENSTVMVELGHHPGWEQDCIDDEVPLHGGCLPGWVRIGSVCYRGDSRTADWALVHEEMGFCKSLHPEATLPTFDNVDEFTYLQGRTTEAFFLNLTRGPAGEFEMGGRCQGFWKAQWSSDNPEPDDVYGYYNDYHKQIRGRRVGQYIYRDYTLCQMIPDDK